MKTNSESEMFGWVDRAYSIARFVFVVLLVVALGMYLINAVMNYRYKVVFIKTPCDLCKDLNRNQSACIDNCFKFSMQIFPDGFNNWKDSKGNCYDMLGKQVTCKTIVPR